jgi:hypothetical protein
MGYNITLTNGTHLATVEDYTVDTSTSLTLMGRGTANYGAQTSNNLVHILENSSNASAPTAPLVGQLWFNSSTKALAMWDGTQWQQIVTANHPSSQSITLTGDVTGTGIGTIPAVLMPPQGFTGAGTAEKITWDSKGRVVTGVNLNSADIATAINGLLVINGTIASTNFTLNSGQSGKITFSDGSIQTTAASTIPFTPVQQGGGTGMGNNKIYLGWTGSALKVQVDGSYSKFVPLSDTSPQLTLPPASANQAGGQLILNGAICQPVTINGTSYGQTQGENIIVDAFARQDIGNQFRVYRANQPIQHILYYNVDTGMLNVDNAQVGGSLQVFGSSTVSGTGWFGSNLTTAGNLTVASNDIRVNGGGSNALLLHVDSGNAYILLTDFPTGSWNSRRPFAINLGTGAVTLGGAGESVAVGSGGLTVYGPQTVGGNQQVNGSSTILGNHQINGHSQVNASQDIAGGLNVGSLITAGAARVTYGAYASGDVNRVVALGDYQLGSGFQILPNGTIFQWGYVTPSNIIANFPLAFPHSVFMFICGNSDQQGSNVDNAYGYAINNAGFFVGTKQSLTANSITSYAVTWFAIGN